MGGGPSHQKSRNPCPRLRPTARCSPPRPASGGPAMITRRRRSSPSVTPRRGCMQGWGSPDALPSHRGPAPPDRRPKQGPGSFLWPESGRGTSRRSIWGERRHTRPRNRGVRGVTQQTERRPAPVELRYEGGHLYPRRGAALRARRAARPREGARRFTILIRQRARRLRTSTTPGAELSSCGGGWTGERGCSAAPLPSRGPGRWCPTPAASPAWNAMLRAWSCRYRCPPAHERGGSQSCAPHAAQPRRGGWIACSPPTPPALRATAGLRPSRRQRAVTVQQVTALGPDSRRGARWRERHAGCDPPTAPALGHPSLMSARPPPRARPGRLLHGGRRRLGGQAAALSRGLRFQERGGGGGSRPTSGGNGGRRETGGAAPRPCPPSVHAHLLDPHAAGAG